MASMFSLPSSLVCAGGGGLSDRVGARRVMSLVLGGCLAACVLLSVPRMDIESPGRGVTAMRPGTVTAVDATSVTVGTDCYALRPMSGDWRATRDTGMLVEPRKAFWQEAVVTLAIGSAGASSWRAASRPSTSRPTSPSSPDCCL